MNRKLLIMSSGKTNVAAKEEVAEVVQGKECKRSCLSTTTRICQGITIIYTLLPMALIISTLH